MGSSRGAKTNFSYIDVNNSTNAPLGIDGVFTGTSTEIKGCGIVFVNVYTDVASATDGLSIQQSSDGTNWDHTDDYTIPAGGTKNYSLNPHSRYFRIVYTNGGTGQSAFRLQTICKSFDAKASSHRIKDDIVGDDDATLSKSAITGENGDGNWHNVSVTSDGHLSVSDRSSGLSIAKGDVTNTTFIHKFGKAPDFDTGDGEVTIWDGADDAKAAQMQYQYSATADIDSISSSNNGDTQDVEIQGLDSNWDLVTQTVTLTGQTRKALSTNLIRVFRMTNVGSTDIAGDVYCYVNSAITLGVPDDSTKVRAVINSSNNQTSMAIYTIPRLKTGYMRDWYAAIAGSLKSTNYVVSLFARPTGEVFQLKHQSAISEGGTSTYKHEYKEPEVFEAKTDLEIRVSITAGGVTGAALAAGFDIVLVDN